MPSFDLAESFFDHPVFVAVVFLTLFLGICGLFAARDFVPLLRGMISTVTSIFVSPFLYMKKAIAELASYGKQGDRILGATDQYLINKILLILRAMTVVCSIGVLSAALVMGWNAMLPPEYLRLQISSSQQQLDKLTEDLTSATSMLGKMDADWRTKRVTLVDQRRAELSQKQGNATKAVEQISQQIGAEPQGDALLASVRSLLESNQGQSKETIQAEIDRANLSDQLKSELSKYVDSWYEATQSQQELAVLTEESARALVQPDWQATKNTVDQSPQSISQGKQDLAGLKAQAQYHPEELLKYAAIGFIEFLGLVWFWGVVYEAIGLAVHMAGDVKRLRQSVEAQESLSLPLPAVVLSGD